MTIKDLYVWAKNRGVEDYTFLFPNFDTDGFFVDSKMIPINDLIYSIDHEKREVIFLD